MCASTRTFRQLPRGSGPLRPTCSTRSITRWWNPTAAFRPALTTEWLLLLRSRSTRRSTTFLCTIQHSRLDTLRRSPYQLIGRSHPELEGEQRRHLCFVSHQARDATTTSCTPSGTTVLLRLRTLAGPAAPRFVEGTRQTVYNAVLAPFATFVSNLPNYRTLSPSMAGTQPGQTR